MNPLDHKLELYILTLLEASVAEAKLVQIRELIYDLPPTTRFVDVDSILRIIQDK